MFRWLTGRAAEPRAALAAIAPAEAKASRTGAMVALHSAGRPVWTARNYAALARAGYMKNPVVYRAVRMVAEAAASVPWLLYDRAAELDRAPAARAACRAQSAPGGRRADGGALRAPAARRQRLCRGGGGGGRGARAACAAARPDERGAGCVAAGRRRSNMRRTGAIVRFAQEGRGGSRRSCTCAQFHPLDDYYGFPPLEAAQASLDVHNAATAWNKALLDNAARPSGALVYKGENGANLSEEQFERLREELVANFSGAGNAGRPLLLEGGLAWQTMSLSPQGHGFSAAKHGAAREIALAFGVPPMLLGIPGDNTYSNYREANLAFWRQTVLPLVARIGGGARRLARAGLGRGAAARLRRGRGRGAVGASARRCGGG